MLHIVDTVEVDAANLHGYCDAVRGLGAVVMADAGAELVSCLASPRDAGEPVTVQCTWAVGGFERWNEIRKALVLDPRWYEYAASLAVLRRGGTRRFLGSVEQGDARSVEQGDARPAAPAVKAADGSDLPIGDAGATRSAPAPMLRRFEMYAVRSDAADGARRRFEDACRGCGHHISEVIDSAVHTNLSEAPVQLVWEHAYDSPDAYRRYMVHPYHATELDRFILADSPERVVADDALGAGLVGYRCDDPVYRMAGGMRRIVLLRVRAGLSPERERELRAALEAAPAETPGMVLAVAARNTLGAAWFDGVTPVGPPPGWSHLWEQGFADRHALDSYRAGSSSLARAERAGWIGWMDGAITRAADVFYEIAGPGLPGAP
jgi:hypothetical protein